MTISVSSSEARKSLGKLLILAREKDEEVVIKVRGEPTAVIVSYSQYEQLIKDKEARKREEALRLLRSARAQFRRGWKEFHVRRLTEWQVLERMRSRRYYSTRMKRPLNRMPFFLLTLTIMGPFDRLYCMAYA